MLFFKDCPIGRDQLLRPKKFGHVPPRLVAGHFPKWVGAFAAINRKWNNLKIKVMMKSSARNWNYMVYLVNNSCF